MDAVGPFDSISGTLMSIPFCIAATLLYGIPDMKRMTTYDDPKINELIGRIQLISDPDVSTLSAIIEADTTEGRTVVQNQPMTTKDFAYDRQTVSKLIRRIGNEQDVPTAAFDRLEAFVDRWPATSIGEALMSFAMVEPKRKAA
jgi:2-methylcitrate dehydratase PrpD